MADTIDIDDVMEGWSYHDAARYPDLAGKSVLIIGGGSGIGAFMVAAFVNQGANVAFISLHDVPAMHVCNQLDEAFGVRPLALLGDIRHTDKLADMIAEASDALGGLDILINNAATDARHTLEEFDEEAWNDNLNINLRPHFFAAKQALPLLRASSAGAITNVGSNAALLGLSGYPAYVAAKAGIAGLTKALARELGEYGIRVNCLVPGWVMTAKQKRLWVTEETLKECLSQQALKSTIKGMDIADAALFLSSASARMISAQSLVVDAGRA